MNPPQIFPSAQQRQDYGDTESSRCGGWRCGETVYRQKLNLDILGLSGKEPEQPDAVVYVGEREMWQSAIEEEREKEMIS